MRILITIISIITILVCSLYENNFLAFKKPIIWSDSVKLTWDDFKGYSKPFFKTKSEFIYNDKNIKPLTFARTYSDMIIEQLSEDSLDLKIYTAFFPGKSFYYFYTDDKNTLDERLLKHEIYHFHIDETFSRFLKFAIINNNDNKSISQLINENISLRESTHRKYDSLTSHGTNHHSQIRFQQTTDSILNVTDFLKDPIVRNIKNKSH